MKSKIQKKEELGLLKSKLPSSKITIFTSFSKAGEKGLSVAQMIELKRLLRSIGSEYFVTKKTLIDLAIKDKNYDGLDVYGMDGSVGLVLGLGKGSGAKPGISVDDDSYNVAKKVYEFAKKNPALHFFGAVMNGKFINLDAFLEVAKMPSREVLIGRLVGMLTYPIRGLAIALSEIAKQK